MFLFLTNYLSFLVRLIIITLLALAIGQLPGYDPCINYYVTNYFNSLDVKEAIHARINTRWSNCR